MESDRWEEVNIMRKEDGGYLVTVWTPVEGTAMSIRHVCSFETIDEVCECLRGDACWPDAEGQ